MFSDHFAHTLDDKNRLTLPARYRPDLEQGVFITRGLDKCLIGFTLKDFKEMSEKIKPLQLTNETARVVSRQIFANATEAVPDRQGRVRIPDHLLEYAGIGKDAVIAGVNLVFEIWNPERWKEQQRFTEENRKEISKLFSSMGI